MRWNPRLAQLLAVSAGVIQTSGIFLFTSPKEAVTWQDALTGRESVSLGAERYHQLVHTEGLVLVGEMSDEGDNHYYSVRKP